MKLIPKASGGYKILNDVFHNIFKGKALKELTPEEWDLAYNYVLKKYGNKESNILQKIRDYHFYATAPDTVVVDSLGRPLQVFHGSNAKDIRNFRLDTPNNASLTKTLDKRIYFSDSKGIAAQYAVDPEYKLALTINHLADGVGLDREGLEIIAESLRMSVKDVKKIIKDYDIGQNFVVRKTSEDDFIYPVYLNMRKHVDVDLDGDIISRLSKKARAEINASPGAIIRNVDETVANQYGIRMRPSTDYLVQYPQQIKRSAAITYDTNGNIIPISKRDDFHNPDINFKEGGVINKFDAGGRVLEYLQKLDKNLKNSIDIYRARLTNGGVKKVVDRGTVRYMPKDIRVFQSAEDLIEYTEKLDRAEHVLPSIFSETEGKVFKNIRLQIANDNISKEEALNTIEAWFGDSSLKKAAIDYVFKPDSKKLKNYRKLESSLMYSSGFNQGNLVYAPNKDALMDMYWIPDDQKKYAKAIENWQHVLPHEFEHAFQDGDLVYSKFFKPKNAIPIMDLAAGRFSPEQLKAMREEMVELLGIKPTSVYLTEPTELLARGTQLKNWLGITDPNKALTASDIKLAKKHYVQTTGNDNNMTEFLDSIVDPEKAAKFLSYATCTAAVVAPATLLVNKDSTITSARKGTQLIRKGEGGLKILEKFKDTKATIKNLFGGSPTFKEFSSKMFNGNEDKTLSALKKAKEQKLIELANQGWSEEELKFAFENISFDDIKDFIKFPEQKAARISPLKATRFSPKEYIPTTTSVFKGKINLDLNRIKRINGAHTKADLTSIDIPAKDAIGRTAISFNGSTKTPQTYKVSESRYSNKYGNQQAVRYIDDAELTEYKREILEPLAERMGADPNQRALISQYNTAGIVEQSAGNATANLSGRDEGFARINIANGYNHSKTDRKKLLLVHENLGHGLEKFFTDDYINDFKKLYGFDKIKDAGDIRAVLSEAKFFLWQEAKKMAGRPVNIDELNEFILKVPDSQMEQLFTLISHKEGAMGETIAKNYAKDPSSYKSVLGKMLGVGAGLGIAELLNENNEVAKAAQGMKFQEASEEKPFYEEIAEMPIYRHLKFQDKANEFMQDLIYLNNIKKIKDGNLTEKGNQFLQRKYNLDNQQLQETLDDLRNAGLYKQGGIITKLIPKNK